MYKISVIIPCYNHGKYVEEAIQSVLNQSYEQVEVIVVNDGSTDAFTNTLLESLTLPKTTILTTSNNGLSAARNTGIAHSSGELVCCLDADDKYHPDFLKKGADILLQDKDQQYGMVTAWVQFFGSSSVMWKTKGHNIDGFESFFQGVRNNLHSSSMFRKACWENAHGFDENMIQGYEDWDFWLKIFSDGFHCYCIEEPLIFYRQQEESMVTRADEVRPMLLEKMYTKHLDFYRDNLVPILLERDWEVRRLEDVNRDLSIQIENLTSYSNTLLGSLKDWLYNSFIKRFL
jgi:glycosyltransferase involved in cell wall biosynthesis